MCGIAGIVSSRAHLVSRERVTKGAAMLRHRGPEKEGTANGSNFAFAHKRLCIIDPGAEGDQPMRRDNRYTIIYNGELYNYIELRKELRDKGLSFHSDSDTEVVLAAYATYGAACLQQFDGMFAFAVWDEQERTIFLARDRFGEKPLYYYYDGEQFLFASEMKALWAMGVEKEVNPSMVYNFLSIDYTSNPADPHETFFLNIQKLPAASHLKFQLNNGEPVVEKYWQVFATAESGMDETAAVAKFTDLLSTSVNRRMRSDVPVGTSLSGGLDSSSIVALCAGLDLPQNSHKCFTASFEGFEKDERDFALMVSKQFKLQHHFTTITEQEVPALMEKLMQHQEEPVISASPLAQLKVYELAAANGVKVLLDGQGADEMLGGYHKYYLWYWQELYRSKTLYRSGEMRKARELGVQVKFGLRQKTAALLPELVQAMWQGRKNRLAWRNPELDRDFAFAQKNNLCYSFPLTPDLNGALYFNSFIYGLEELLRLADRNSMAHSIEVRLPFLQHQMAEWLFSLPPGMKIRNGWTKWLLRQAMASRLPEAIIWRKDKTGFEPPQKKWMQHPHVQKEIMLAREILVSKKILSPAVLNKKIQPHDAHVAENKDWKYWSLSWLYR